MAQQSLVRKLDFPIADGHQAGLRQLHEDGSGSVDELELAQRHPAAYQCCILAAGEPQHQTTRDLPLARAELCYAVSAMRATAPRTPPVAR